MNRLLLVGWDAADWKVARPLMERGEMPHLARLCREGAWGNLATLYPALSPMVWTSIATGKRPYKHGIHGFTEPTEDGAGVRAVSNLGRTAKAFWNILNQNGKRSVVVGWWPSHPAEPIRGAMVSNHFPLPTSDAPGTPMAAGTVWPQEWQERLADLRIHGIEIEGEMLRMFVPEAGQVDQKQDKSLHDLAGLIAEAMSIHAAATDLMEHEKWDLAAVYYPGIDHFSHRFMRFHARKKHNPRFQGVIANAYRFHDVMLGRLLELAGPDCGTLLLSDHGFHSDKLLPGYIPAEAAGPAVEHRDFGVFCLRGPGVRRGERIYGASVLDIAPTVLHCFGLPAGADMDGRVLVNAFAGGAVPQPIPSWEDVAGEDGRHPPSRQYDGAASTEALRQLAALGYIAPPGEDARQVVEDCLVENQYNLARAWMNGGFPQEATAILEGLIAADPDQGRYYEQLFSCRMAELDYAGAGSVLDAFDAAAAKFAPRAAAEWEQWLADHPEPMTENTPENYRARQAHEKSSGYSMTRLMLRTRLALVEGKAEARALLEQIADGAGNGLELALFLAEGFSVSGDGDRALTYTRRIRRADPENWQAMALEARVHAAAGRHEEVVKRAIDSLALVPFQPFLHHQLGASLAQLGETKSAVDSFRAAIFHMPGLVASHEALGELLRRDTATLGEASLHMARARVLREQERVAKKAPVAEATATPRFERWDGSPEARQETVTIVSGLPRSGTSMMMQMLAGAGIPAHTDGQREADEDNPRGYFEHGDATRLRTDASWVPAARGRAVKIVAQLLPHLPEGERYRIIFMRRNLDEVTASQRAMLERLGRKGAGLADRKLQSVYNRQLAGVWTWLQAQPGIQVIAVEYEEALRDPRAVAARLAAFLGEPFDVRAAAACVVGSLRRQRQG